MENNSDTWRQPRVASFSSPYTSVNKWSSHPHSLNLPIFSLSLSLSLSILKEIKAAQAILYKNDVLLGPTPEGSEKECFMHNLTPYLNSPPI